MQQPLLDPKQVNLPFTIGIIKPDTVLEPKKLSDILALINNSKSLIIKTMFQRELTKQQITNLFYRHQNKPYFEELVKYMTSGECCVMVLCNAEESSGDPIIKWKKMIGLSNPEQAKKSAPDSLRAKHGKNQLKNQFHGSDNLQDANKQRKIFQFKVPQQQPQYRDDFNKITIKSIKQFLMPSNLEHSCINERMDILALYGPVVNWHSIEQCFCAKCKPFVRELCSKIKQQLKARVLKLLKQPQIRQIFNDLCGHCQQHCSTFSHVLGGRDMQHILTDNEISQLAQQNNRKQLIEMLTIEKGSVAKIMIDTIQIKQPKQIVYNIDFFNLLIQPLEYDYYNRYQFRELQNLLLEDRRIRISYWVAKITGKSVDRFPSVTTLNNTLTPEQLKDPKSPFFTLNRKLPLPLLIKTESIKNVPKLFTQSIADKKKLARIQQNIVVEKLMHRHLTKVITIGQKGEGHREAITLLRPYNQGRHDDWDNYSALRGNHEKAPIGGKNMDTVLQSQSQ